MNQGEEKYTTTNFTQTRELGQKFARQIRGGVVALHGDLGSGKTTFVQGLAKGLGITKKIISPTFIIVRTYEISRHSGKRVKRAHPESLDDKRSWTGQDDAFHVKNFYHVDLYRIESENDVDGLGLVELMHDPENIVVIEWPDKIEHLLPEKRIDIFFEYVDENKRKIRIE